MASISRRDFCQTAIGATGLAIGSLAAAQSRLPGNDRLPIIDTHQHLWDLTRFELPWLRDYEALRRSYTIDDYRKSAGQANIVQTIYMEVDVAPAQRQAEADHVIALCKQPESRMAAAVVGGSPESKGFADYVRGLKESGVVKGVRAAVRTSGAGATVRLDTDFVAGVRLLGRNEMSFDINVGPDQLPTAAALIDQAPDTRYVLDHCGNFNLRAKPEEVERWKRGIAEVAKRKQVVCKVSGFITNDDQSPRMIPTTEQIARVVDHVYDCFGPDRVMFAGDWPVCTLAMSLGEWVGVLGSVVKDRPPQDQKKLFHDNAKSFYAD
jgi:predicted TIM-barrel fold metal-dependent hydrolase